MRLLINHRHGFAMQAQPDRLADVDEGEKSTRPLHSPTEINLGLSGHALGRRRGWDLADQQPADVVPSASTKTMVKRPSS